MEQSRAVLIDQSLKSVLGHHLEYTEASRLAYSASGFLAKIYCHLNCDESTARNFKLQPWFHETWTERQKASMLSGLLWAAFRIFGISISQDLAPNSFGADLLRLARELQLSPNDEVFIHTLNFIQLLQVAQVIGKLNQCPKFRIVLRQDPTEASRFGFKQFLIRFIFAAIRRTPNLAFYADTAALCSEYERVSGLRFRRLPILFDQSELAFIPNSISHSFTVTFLGDGRLEKGFQHLPQIIRETLKKTKNVYFNLQAFLTIGSSAVEELAKARAELRELAASDPDRVRLTERPLDPDEYTAMLQGADLVLVPYNREAYKLRSSGILAQAAGSGKLTILPSRTSLADDAPPSTSKQYESEDEISDLIVDFAKHAPSNDVRKKAALEFSAAHSEKQFIEVLASRV